MFLKEGFKNIRHFIVPENGGGSTEKKLDPETVNKIKILKKLLDQLENSQKDLNSFKGAKENVISLPEVYPQYTAERKIDSLSGILNDEFLSNDIDVTDYKEKSEGLKDDLEELAKTKKLAQETFPELYLDFRGGLRNGETMSPREESIIIIKDQIKKLESNLLISEVSKTDEQEKIKYQKWAVKLDELQKRYNNGSGVEFIHWIVSDLEKGDLAAAKADYRNQSDKYSRYPEAKNFLIEIGIA